MQSLFPAAPSDLGDDDLAGLYGYPVEQSWVRANFVSSLDGSVQGADDTSSSLSSAADQRLFALLRSLADVILVGAGTVRAEGYRRVQPDEVDTALRARLGLAGVPTLAVVSGSLALDAELVEAGCGPDAAGADDGCPLVVFTTAAAPSGPRGRLARHARVVTAGTHTVDLSEAVDQLTGMGLRRVLCEGGPSLLRGLAASRRLDDFCLTLSPQLVAGDHRRVTHGRPLDPPVGLRLRHLLHDDGVLFARYTREEGPR